jgi:protein-S-isoprenylcysteine O-methyltransferase Ste14
MHPSLRCPPAYLFLAILAMVLLHKFIPVAQVVPAPWNYTGFEFIAAGAALGIWALLLFRRHGTSTLPGRKPTALVTRGPFSITRNPMYLSMSLGLIGFAVWLGSLTPWLAVPLYWLAINFVVIPFEEKNVESAFGDEYRAYRTRVRRWL